MENILDSTFAFLEGQLRAYAESWESAPVEVIDAWQLQGRLKVYLDLYEFIRQVDHHWSEAVHAGAAYRLDEAKSIETLYLAWLRSSDRVAKAIGAAHAKGQPIDGYWHFKDAWLEVRIKTATPIEMFFAAVEETGGDRPFAEVINEIRRRHVAASV